jgi:hypothetical protein
MEAMMTACTMVNLRVYALALASAGISFGLGHAPATGQSREAPPAFEMSAQQGAFRRIADEFMAAAAAGDAMRTARLLSPSVAARTGQAGVDRFLAGEVLPFFAQFKEVAASVTVTRTAEVTGFAFYMYMVSKAGELRPFVIYVIEEDGAKMVANVLVDRLVEGRHCMRADAGWSCPDFSG